MKKRLFQIIVAITVVLSIYLMLRSVFAPTAPEITSLEGAGDPADPYKPSLSSKVIAYIEKNFPDPTEKKAVYQMARLYQTILENRLSDKEEDVASGRAVACLVDRLPGRSSRILRELEALTFDTIAKSRVFIHRNAEGSGKRLGYIHYGKFEGCDP